MPTASGRETIDERIARLSSRLAKVRAALDVSLDNGSSFSINGTSVTQVQYERLKKEEGELTEEIDALYARKEGGRKTQGIAHTVTVNAVFGS